jgi:hypothetical protein
MMVSESVWPLHLTDFGLVLLPSPRMPWDFEIVTGFRKKTALSADQSADKDAGFIEHVQDAPQNERRGTKGQTR